MSVTKIVTFTTFGRLEPPARRTRSRLTRACSACLSKSADTDDLAVSADSRLPRDEEKLSDPSSLGEIERFVGVGRDRDLLNLHLAFFSSSTPMGTVRLVNRTGRVGNRAGCLTRTFIRFKPLIRAISDTSAASSSSL